MIGLRAICFDAYGTLVEAAKPMSAMHDFLRGIRCKEPREAVIALMKGKASFRSLAAAADVDPDSHLVRDAELRILDEASSVRLIPGMEECWRQVRERGHRIAICSNLGDVFVAPLLAALPDAPDVSVMSCEVGLVKPEPEIYALVAERLKLHPSEVLFIGDREENDYAAPRNAGMKAMRVDAFRDLCQRPAGAGVVF